MARRLFTLIAGAKPVGVISASNERASLAVGRHMLERLQLDERHSILGVREPNEEERASFEAKARSFFGGLSLAGIVLEQ